MLKSFLNVCLTFDRVPLLQKEVVGSSLEYLFLAFSESQIGHTMANFYLLKVRTKDW